MCYSLNCFNGFRRSKVKKLLLARGNTLLIMIPHKLIRRLESGKNQREVVVGRFNPFYRPQRPLGRVQV
jgi:hypothetical protein